MESEQQKPGSEASDRQVVDSQTLLRGQKQLVIQHGDEVYRLILTRNNRLILQK